MTSLSDLHRALHSLSKPRRVSYIKLAVVAVFLLRSRLFSVPRNLLKLKVKAAGLVSNGNGVDPNSTTTHENVPLYLEEENGSKTLLVPFRGRISKVKITPVSASYIAATRTLFPRLQPSPDDPHSTSQSSKPSKSTVSQLISILRIAFPSIRSKQTLVLILHSAFLVLRTYLSVLVAKLDGRIVRDLVSANAAGFGRGLILWFLLAIPSTYTNSMLRHLQSKLSLHLRTTLTRYAHDLYFSPAPLLRYYRISHGQPSERLEGVDQYITADIAAFCDSLSALYGNIMKPSLDMLIFTSQLSRSLGFRGTVLLFLNYYATAKILRSVTPAFGRLAAVERGLEGEFRAGMGRVGRESEEIAFYGGGPRERDILWRAYLRLVKHINSIFKIRIAYEWTEDFVIKYAWSAAGYLLISIPILFTRRQRSVAVQTSLQHAETVDDAVAIRTENYISSRRLLLSLADAGGRLMFAYKDILELAGLSSRLYMLFSTLHTIESPPEFVRNADRVALHHVNIEVPGEHLQLVKGLNLELPASTGNGAEDLDFEPVTEQGESTSIGDHIWKMNPGEHLMITGSNGVGKTAIARVIAELWPSVGDVLERPDRGVNGIFVLPQRAYMVVGSLLDQIIYPHSHAQFIHSGKTLDDLMNILRTVHLEYLPEREGGWGTVKEWRDVLSGGEKQRMGMARVFYHRPRFAVLDECTSAVSSDVEGLMYQHAKDVGITLITISLRPSLAKYHTRMLSLLGDGTGRWTMTRVGTAEERMGIDREIVSLEAKLAEVGKWEARIKELNGLLGVEADTNLVDT
ncbi:ABC transporter transmembrane region 2-domain-containing protein [Hysterangium stoloniferum]|nr:ABC transporter transmembrane region 2-domain-containing protein [Hysterangium stoloniferum]